MTFGTFFLYFIISELILQCIVLIISFGVMYYSKRKLENEVKKHGLVMLTDEEIAKLFDINKKNWN